MFQFAKITLVLVFGRVHQQTEYESSASKFSFEQKANSLTVETVTLKTKYLLQSFCKHLLCSTMLPIVFINSTRSFFGKKIPTC